MHSQNLFWPPPADIGQPIRNRFLTVRRSIWRSWLLGLALTGLVGLAPTALRAAQHPLAASTAPDANPIPPAEPGTALTILSPQVGQATNGSQVTVKLRVGNYLNPNSLLVYLNGADVSAVSTAPCAVTMPANGRPSSRLSRISSMAKTPCAPAPNATTIASIRIACTSATAVICLLQTGGITVCRRPTDLPLLHALLYSQVH